ncbi:hypothetical protein GGR54DRAFT_158036 [Hypoxylon sp. NC1633]|nr:hypothetical protein GGR54DRAFT_158036 [Hypoxylon sp. NC1633]
MDVVDQNNDGHGVEGFSEWALLDALDSIRTKGDFACFEPTPRLDPIIVVHDVGLIHLPLSEAQAKQIIAKSRQAPYGKGSETIVDTSVRNTWELDPGQFEIRFPNWQAVLDDILVGVDEEMDVNSPITAKLYKMLVYEKGAMFKAHTDTEKIPGMFGTLVISLSSPHEGGDVVVTHCGVSKTLRTSQHDTAYASWYSDVTHEVLPVKSGYRLVLTYNLATDPTAELPTVDSLHNEPRELELRRVLQLWSQEVSNGLRGPSPLYYILDHKYTEANISYRGLKTNDRIRTECLLKICAELGFDLFLTTMEREEFGIPDDHYYDGYHELDFVVDRSNKLKAIFELTGNRLTSDVEFDEDDILGEDPFDDEPDEENYTGFMGNSGPEAMHWYRLSALIIVPQAGILSFLSPASGRRLLQDSDFRSLCSYLTTQCTNSPGSKQPVAQLLEWLETCEHKTRRWTLPKKLLTSDLILRILEISMLNHELKLLRLVIDTYTERVPVELFRRMREEYDKLTISVDEFRECFTLAFETQSTVRQSHEAISAVIGDAEPTEELRDIVSQAVESYLRSCETRDLDAQDGAAILDLCLRHRDFSYVERTILPIVERRIEWTPFVLGFLGELHQSMERRQVPRDKVGPIYARISGCAVQGLNLAWLTAVKAAQEEKPHPIPFLYPRISEPLKCRTNYMTHNLMFQFISTLVSLELFDQLQLLVGKIQSQATQLVGQELNSLWIPLLHELFSVLDWHNSSPKVCWKQTYQSLLLVYLKNYVKEKPLMPDLSRRAVSCSCKDCANLNQLLVDPTRNTGRFPMGKMRRLHLHQQLERSNIDCTHLTERYGNPHTLVVTKTETQSKLKILAWLQRRLEAESQLKAFDQDKLQIVLGDKFDDIMSMEMLEAEAQPVTSNASSATTSIAQHPSSWAPNASSVPKATTTSRTAPAKWGNQILRDIGWIGGSGANNSPSSSGNAPSRPTQTIPNPIAGAKRKYIEIIDLTEDE